MNRNSTLSVDVEPGGTQVVAHAGLHALGCFADRVGLGQALSRAVPWSGERAPTHDRGTVLTHAMLMLAAGGEACSDIEFLASQPRLFGQVASAPTLYRTIRNITPTVLTDLAAATATVRADMWRRMAATVGTAKVVLDIDASLVQIHSENKAGTGPTYKGGFGFHPLMCFADATGEALSAMLRPGNAGANTVTDHLDVLDAAVAQLPGEIAAGHRRGDDSLVKRAVQVRTDSAGCTRGFVHGCRARNIGFAVVARSNASIHAAISRINTDQSGRWQPARRFSGDPAVRSDVAEVTDLCDLSDWPSGTRMIVRREHLHQGAQRSLFPSTEFRYWGHYTDATGSPVELDAHMRAHAHVEDHIKRLKDSGLERFPFTDLNANKAWLQLVCGAADLVRWFQQLCCTGPLATAQPKRLRWTLWHTPARIVKRAGRVIMRIIDDWPTTHDLLEAHRHIAALC
ncbi:MAG: IS1380 family transposase [Pseudonocardiales bacterium]|nr:IS1380 family transposase [Pseudonocardiales bacterium]